MREYFITLFKELKVLTGVRQYEDIASLPDKDQAQEMLNDVVRALVNVSNTFSYIPDKDKQRIIRRKILEDPDFYGLNAKKIYQYLNSVSDKYFAESHHLEVNQIEVPHEMPPLSAETQKMIDDYLLQLSSGLGSKTITNVEMEKDKIKYEDSQKQKKVAASNGYTPPSEDFVRMAELKREWARTNTDLFSGKILPNSPSFEEWVKDR